MSSGIIENAEELKKLYLQTDITNAAVVQSAVKEISENVYVAGKEKYLVALNVATPANISKARKYQKMAANTITKNIGWIIMAVFAIWMGIQDWGDDSTWQSLGFWVGAGIQIYIATLKSVWDKLTLSGAVVHPALKSGSAPMASISNPIKTQTDQSKPVTTVPADEFVFCNECGQKNKRNARFCENCGAKLHE